MADMNALRDWRFSIDLQGIAWAVFDREGESQNSLGRRRAGGAGGHRRAGRAGRARQVDPRARLHLRQGEGLHRRRRRARVRAAAQTSAGGRQRHAGQRLSRPHRAAADPGGVLHPRLLPRRRPGAGARLPLAHRHARRRHAPRLPRGAARHLPGLQRHGALDPPGRRAGRHADDADRLDDPRQRRARHGPDRRAGAEPAQPALGGAQGGRAQAQVQARGRSGRTCCGSGRRAGCWPRSCAPRPPRRCARSTIPRPSA